MLASSIAISESYLITTPIQGTHTYTADAMLLDRISLAARPCERKWPGGEDALSQISGIMLYGNRVRTRRLQGSRFKVHR